MNDPTETTPGTVAHHTTHKPCLLRIAALEHCLEDIVAECVEREDASIEADGSARPNPWMRIHLRIREVLPR